MEHNAKTKLNAQIYEEACSWFVENRAGSLDDCGHRDFDQWLRKSPEHLGAYLEIAALWNEGPFDPDNKWDDETLVKDIATDVDNVISHPRNNVAGAAFDLSNQSQPHSEPARSISDKKHRSNRAHRTVWTLKRWMAAAASIATLLAAGGTLLFTQLSLPVYATAMGEQRSIQFSDGSTVELNSRSKIRVHYSKNERDFELIFGQALFQVAKDRTRPFVVSIGETKVRAVGTEFDVYRKREGTVVTVLEGQVAIVPTADLQNFAGRRALSESGAIVSSDRKDGASTDSSASIQPLLRRDAGAAPIFLLAGEQLTVKEDVVQKADHPNIAGATAWTQRQVVFESASLAEVADEFNRYNERQIVIEDQKLVRFHISGIFSTTDTESLVSFLRQRAGVRVIETATEIRVVKNTAP